MGDISENFNRSEFACKCGCGFDTVDAQLLAILEIIREHFSVPVKVTSGARCADYNTTIGGAEKSQHVLGRAADIVVSGHPPIAVAAFCRSLDIPGIGDYQTFTHLDTRTGRARW